MAKGPSWGSSCLVKLGQLGKLGTESSWFLWDAESFPPFSPVWVKPLFFLFLWRLHERLQMQKSADEPATRTRRGPEDTAAVTHGRAAQKNPCSHGNRQHGCWSAESHPVTSATAFYYMLLHVITCDFYWTNSLNINTGVQEALKRRKLS